MPLKVRRKRSRQQRKILKQFHEIDAAAQAPLLEGRSEPARTFSAWVAPQTPRLLNLDSFIGLVTGNRPGASLPQYLECPRHAGAKSLRVFMGVDGTAWFRCHHCGTCRSHVEVAQAAINGSIDQALDWLKSHKLIKSVDPEFKATWEWRQQLLKLFFRGRATYLEKSSRTGEAMPFGDWASFSSWEMRRTFGHHTYNLGPPQDYYDVKLSRTITGAPGVLTFHNKLQVPVFRVVLTESQIMLDLPRWAEDYDWTEGLVVCESVLDAKMMNKMSVSYALNRRVPVASLSYGFAQAMFNPTPIPSVVFVPMNPKDLRKAFLFSDNESRLSVARQASCYSEMGRTSFWEAVSRQMPFDAETGILWLNDLLSTPWITQFARHKLLTMAAHRYNMSAQAVTDALRPGCSPHCITSTNNHRLFCAKDVMWCMDRSEEPREISNFVLHLLRRHENGWNVELRVMGRAAYDSVTNSQIETPYKVLRTVREIAAKHSLAEPIFFDRILERYLVALVKTTSLLYHNNL